MSCPLVSAKFVNSAPRHGLSTNYDVHVETILNSPTKMGGWTGEEGEGNYCFMGGGGEILSRKSEGRGRGEVLGCRPLIDGKGKKET